MIIGSDLGLPLQEQFDKGNGGTCQHSMESAGTDHSLPFILDIISVHYWFGFVLSECLGLVFHNNQEVTQLIGDLSTRSWTCVLYKKIIMSNYYSRSDNI